MAITNHERVGKAMELLKDGLGSFVERELKNAYKDKAASQALRYVGDDKLLAKKARDRMGRGGATQTHVGSVERCLPQHLGASRTDIGQRIARCA